MAPSRDRVSVAGVTDDFSRIRAEYEVPGMDIDELDPDPIRQFKLWFDEAITAGIAEPNTMTVATVAAGRPRARSILLKGVEDDGFVFFTNYDSDKGLEMATVPDVALSFYWQPLHRQVRVEGRADKVAAASSDAYFRTRPRGAQLAALASAQSRPLPDRATLHERFREVEREYEGRAIPRPSSWGGYRVEPELIEFWQGQVNRLHDRIVYGAGPDGWTMGRLSP